MTNARPTRRRQAARVGKWASVALVAGTVTLTGTTAAHATNQPARVETGAAWTGTTESLSTAPQVLKVAGVESADYAEKLRRATEREAQRLAEAAALQAEADRIAREAAEQAAAQAAREAAEQAAREEAARRPAVAFPAAGTFTSGFGPRWGTSHNGIDIANSIGTPILSVTNGTVLESGPASGFGLWVRIAQDDGTIAVFGHIDRSLVSAGQQVHAGQQIATMGNRGQSTGPHLHFEVWHANGTKIDPAPWLAARGVPINGGRLG
ncbi:M23 family metallopeptidase [Rhodococcus chondri]|uniref:M23 family metallopeptidase n=1 Tax=Rhodococcus chondri TaxID=3065941 RepID=UPI0038B5F686